MEPGHEDREDANFLKGLRETESPQWSPAIKAGKTAIQYDGSLNSALPQWSPAIKAGKTRDAQGPVWADYLPQWSPAIKAGKTGP